MSINHLVRIPLALFFAAAAAPAVAGCFSVPETCHGCRVDRADGSLPGSGASTVTGGASGVAGVQGTGGVVVGAGGAATGGGAPPASGGANGSGGVLDTGGRSAMGGNSPAQSGGRGGGGAPNTGGTGGRGAGGLPGSGGAATASGGRAAGGASGTGGAAGIAGAAGNGGDPDLVLWYRFDESPGTVIANDSALFGGTPRNGMLSTAGTGGTATFTATKQVGTHAVSLAAAATAPNTNGGYVSLGSGLQALVPGAVTVAVWVNLTANGAAQTWQRVFDIGASSTAYMYVTTRTDTGATPVRFAITTGGNTAEQRIDGTAPLSAGTWHHIAVVLAAGASPYTGTLYIDGAAVGTNTAMTLRPVDLGTTPNNWLGRSEFAGNPYLTGLLDDFRVYRRALSAAEIARLFTTVR